MIKKKLNRIAIELYRNKKRLIEVETADNSQQLGDGQIIFSSIDAKIKGNTAKLEKNPSNYRIGFWSNLSDSIFWNYKATRWGMYDVELTYSLESKKSKIHIQIGDNSINSEIQATNSWYKYNTVRLGKIYLPKSGQYLIAVKGVEKESAAVMNFKSLVLVPTSEGKEIIQSGRNISLHSRDSKVNGVTLRYEPAQKNNVLDIGQIHLTGRHGILLLKNQVIIRLLFAKAVEEGMAGARCLSFQGLKN